MQQQCLRLQRPAPDPSVMHAAQAGSGWAQLLLRWTSPLRPCELSHARWFWTPGAALRHDTGWQSCDCWACFTDWCCGLCMCSNKELQEQRQIALDKQAMAQAKANGEPPVLSSRRLLSVETVLLTCSASVEAQC